MEKLLGTIIGYSTFISKERILGGKVSWVGGRDEEGNCRQNV